MRRNTRITIAVYVHAPGENIFRFCNHSLQSVSNLLRCEPPCGISNGVKGLGDTLHRALPAVAAPIRPTVTTGRASPIAPTASGFGRGLCDARGRLQGLQWNVHPAKQTDRKATKKRHVVVRCIFFSAQQRRCDDAV